jgi:hypothetical protein
MFLGCCRLAVNLRPQSTVSRQQDGHIAAKAPDHLAPGFQRRRPHPTFPSFFHSVE